ncbi:MAG: hypothetical protein FJ086_00365, partial [Deltaproteobacteria bacterium]|nr:hypothetical protein [Deltaproteobacteria bacterium]
MTPPLFHLLTHPASARDVDWPRLASSACAHGLAGVVLAEAGRAGLPLPVDAAEGLKKQAQAVAAQALRASLLLARA